MKKHWKWIAVAALLLTACALLVRGCSARKRGHSVTTSTRIDTLRATDTVFFPAPYTVTKAVDIPQPIDTAAVIENYFASRRYLINYQDSVLKAVTDLSVKENAVEVASLDYEILRKTNTVTVTQYQEHLWTFGIGGGISYNLEERSPGLELSIGIGYKRNLFYAGYDFQNRTPRIGWQYQIVRH